MGDEALEGGANGKIRTKPEADLLHFYCVMRKTASPIQSQVLQTPGSRNPTSVASGWLGAF